MEKLGRGVVAVRSEQQPVLVTWRLLGLDPDGIGFNVYRSAAGGAEVKLNSAVLTGGTNYTDTTANLGQANTYRVRPVIGGAEQAPSGAFTLTANHATEPVVRVPLRAGGAVKFVWVGDLDGDGEYDYVVDRQTSPQTIEAYRSNGQFLWSVDMGPNSTNQNNIEGGSATIDVGHNDGVTVYDLDSDGRPRSPSGSPTASGSATGPLHATPTTTAVHRHPRRHDRRAPQLGRGADRLPRRRPDDARFGVGYLDGVNPAWSRT